MKITIPMSPNIFAILKGIQDEESISYAKFAACLSGNESAAPNPARTKRYCARNDKLKRLLVQYETSELKDYMDALKCSYTEQCVTETFLKKVIDCILVDIRQ